MVLTPTRLSPRFIFCSPIVNCENRLAQNSAKDMGFPNVGLQLSPLVRSYCICRWSYGKYLTLLTWREWQPVVDVYVNLWKELFDNWKHNNFSFASCWCVNCHQFEIWSQNTSGAKEIQENSLPKLLHQQLALNLMFSITKEYFTKFTYLRQIITCHRWATSNICCNFNENNRW